MLPVTLLNLSTASSSLTTQNFDESRAHSISPDSALFEIPASECSGDDERYFSSHDMVAKNKISKCLENGIQIEELDVCF